MKRHCSTTYPAPRTRLLSRAEVAEALSVSGRTVDRLAAAGELIRVRVGSGCVRYRQVDLDRLIQRGLDAGREAV